MIPKTTTAQALLGTAFHEIRHRVQHRCKIRRFSARTRLGEKDKLGRNIQEYLKRKFKLRWKKMEEEGKPVREIRRRNSVDEFDAEFIELLTLCVVGRKRLMGKNGHLGNVDFMKSIICSLMREP